MTRLRRASWAAACLMVAPGAYLAAVGKGTWDLESASAQCIERAALASVAGNSRAWGVWFDGKAGGEDPGYSAVQACMTSKGYTLTASCSADVTDPSGARSCFERTWRVFVP